MWTSLTLWVPVWRCAGEYSALGSQKMLDALELGLQAVVSGPTISQVLGIGLGSSTRAVEACNYPAISPALHVGFRRSPLVAVDALPKHVFSCIRMAGGMLLPNADQVQPSIQVPMTFWDILVDIDLTMTDKYDGASHQLCLSRLRLWRSEHLDSALPLPINLQWWHQRKRAGLTTITDDQERNSFLTHLNNNPMCKIKTSQPLAEPDPDQLPSLRTLSSAQHEHTKDFMAAA